MKILMISWSFTPRVGGAVTTALDLGGALKTLGMNVEILAPSVDSNDSISENGLRVHRVKVPGIKQYDSNLSRFIYIYAMSKKIRCISKNYDLIIAHDFNVGTWSAVLAGVHPLLSVFGADPLYEYMNYNRKKVVTYAQIHKRFSYILLRVFVKIFIRKIDYVLNPHLSNGKFLREHGAKNIVSIPCGVDISRFSQGYRSDTEQDPYILFVGRYVCWKNIDGAVEVFRRARKTIKNLRLKIVSAGPLKTYYIKKYSQLAGLEFMDKVSSEDIRDLYLNASVFILPSFYETFSIVVSEAMASKVPVVASRLPVLEGRIEDGVSGFLIDPGDYESFAEKVIYVIRNSSEAKRLTAKAFEKIQLHDINKIAQLHFELYKKVLPNF